MLPPLTSLKKNPVTLTFAALTIFGFLFFTPSDIAVFNDLAVPYLYLLLPVKLVLGALLHLNLFHLVTNLVIWIAAGLHLETDIGSKSLLGITLAAIIIGGVLETLLVNANFIGLSSACYGLIGLIIWNRIGVSQGLAIGLIAIVLIGGLDFIFNWGANNREIAYGAHFGGLMAGFFSGFGLGQKNTNSAKAVFRPMQDYDIESVLDIIYAHDEDDGEEAAAAFKKTLEHKFVLALGRQVIGMTGFRPDPDAPRTAWLSFTYIHEDFRQNGHAYWMMLQLRDVLQAHDIERLFIATSDYIDEDSGEDIYLAARNFYEYKLNAEREILIENFYGPGEARYIYSLPVTEQVASPSPRPDNVKARFVGLNQAAESDTSYVAEWEELIDGEANAESKLETKSLQDLIDEVSSYNGKALFVTLPDYISDQHVQELRGAGFREIGTLRDYFAKGVGETYWGLYIA